MRPVAALWLAISLLCGRAPGQTNPRVDPKRELWSSIERTLRTPEGEQYFESSMKDALLPRLKGTLLAVSRQEGSIRLTLALTDPATPEVTLILRNLESKIKNEPKKGAQVLFEAVPIAFAKEPFLVTFEVDDKESTVIEPLGSMAPWWYFGHALDTVRSARYHDRLTSLEFDLPSDWSLAGTWPSPSENGNIAVLKNANFGDAFAAVWMESHNPIPNQLEKAAQDIVAHRSELQGYKILQESIHQTFIGGHQALTAVAEYTDNGRKMAENLTWIATEHTTALFSARLPAYDLEIFQVRFDQIIYSAIVP
jgi:hypothetical protein